MFHLKKAFVPALIAGILAAGSAAAAPARLVTQLEVEEAWLSGNDDVNLRFTLANESAAPVSVLKWQTPFEGVDDDIFTVARNGEKVTYLGRHVKRAAPTDKDFLVLAPGQRLSVKVELSKYYDMSRMGEYTVSFEQSLQGPGARFTETGSNLVSVWIDSDAVVASNPNEEEALTPTYVSCSNSQKNQLVTALGNAETYSANSYTYLSTRTTTAQRNASTRYKTWFGTQTSSRWSTVQSHFLNIRNTIQTKTIKFNCACSDDYYAYVYPAQPYQIWLCNAFWSAPATGTDSKAGTLVHELSHFNVVAGTDDHAYGQSACKSLATSNPSRAVDNADSHEYFAENTPSLP
jgi:peptidyl-Lys metalloendopeptidase